MNMLILNVHSALNLGDAAIMDETLRSLGAAFPGATITIAANDPNSWRIYASAQVVGSLTSWVVDRRHQGWRWRKPALLAYTALLTLAALVFRLTRFRLRFGAPEQQRLLMAYYDADLVISCGGGNFYAHRPFSVALLWSIATVAFALALNKPVVFLPQSIGPIEGRSQRRLMRLLLDRAACVMVREQRSLAFVSALKIRRQPIVLPDLAFGLPAPPGKQESCDLQGDRPLHIGVTVIDRAAQEPRFAAQQQYEDALVAALARLNSERGVQITIFAQCYGPTPDQDDRQCSQRIYERLRQQVADVRLADPSPNAMALKAAYQAMDALIGSRMHTGIFALSSGVPVILVSYQPKANGLMQLFGLERYCCDIAALSADCLYAAICDMLDRRPQLRAQIRRQMDLVRSELHAWPRYLQHLSA